MASMSKQHSCWLLSQWRWPMALLLLELGACAASTMPTDATSFPIERFIHRTLQPARLHVGERCRFALYYLLPKEALTALAPLIPNEGIGIVERTERVAWFEQDLWWKEEIFLLQAEQVGIYLFPGMQQTIADVDPNKRATISTPDIWLEIIAANANSESALLLPPLQEDWPIRLSTSSLLGIVLIGLLLAIVVATTWWHNRHRVPIQLKSLSAAEIGLAALEQLGHQTISSDLIVRQWHSDMSSILRTYLIHQFALPWQERTTPELFQTLQYQRQLPAQAFTALVEIFTSCDNVKFSGRAPTSQQMMALLQLAKQFVQQTSKEQP